MDDNFDDYFTDAHVPEENKANHQETEQEREEREIKEATIERRGNSVKLLLTLIIIAMVLFLGWWVWQYYFHPYRVSQKKGWIMKVSNEGSVFQTYEGEMITESYIEDTLVAMTSNFLFSIPADSITREAMRYAFRHKELKLVVGRKFHSHMLSVSWRPFAYVDCHIKHLAFHHSHKLGLCKWRFLEMQPAHHSSRRARFIVLHKADLDTGLLPEVTGIIAFEEVTTGIAEHSRFYDEYTVYVGLADSHCSASLSRYCPYWFLAMG